MKNITTLSGWARIWLIFSVTITAGTLIHGLSHYDKPSHKRLNVKVMPEIEQQMVDPKCQPLKNDSLISSAASTLPVEKGIELLEQCKYFSYYRVMFYQLLGKESYYYFKPENLPNDPEWYRNQVEVIRATSAKELNEYRWHVYAIPTMAFFGSWLAFFFFRKTAHWVAAGFNNN